MTITFVPGEVNKSAHSVAQGNWKNHHILVYGSGNNLIITGATLSPGNKKPNPSNIEKNLQTIYLDRDPQAIDIDSQNGRIVIAVGSTIIVYAPVNEYMKIPKWSQCLEFKVDETVNCVKWACCEDEIVVGTGLNLMLFHIYNEYGDLKITKRWCSPQSNPISDLIITSYGSKILTTSGHYDRMVKVWSRINYSDDNTLFEVSYLQHPRGTYVSAYHCRVHHDESHQEHQPRRRITDPSMANIKNIRGYIDNANQDNGDIIYTFTNDYQLRVWASYEYSGHNHIQCWANLDLSTSFTSICSILIIENYYMNQGVITLLKKLTHDFASDDSDLLLVISDLGEFKLFAITNISQCPPNNIHFIPINPDKSYRFTENSFPVDTKKQSPAITLNSIQSEEFITSILNPILVKDIAFLNNDPHIHHLSFAIHDRIKNTIRYDILDLYKLLDPHTDSSGISLVSKFQGHTKSIRKIVKSNSLFSKHNILLSISNFPEHNYIWEPIILSEDQFNIMSVTKRFQINVSHADDSKCAGICDAVIINDVEPPVGLRRRHIVVSIERDGHISVWDCNQDDQPAELITRHNLTFKQPPRAFILTQWPSEDHIESQVKQYCILAIFEQDLVHAWRLTLSYTEDHKITEIRFVDQPISSIPQEEEIYQIGTVDAFIQQHTGSVLSVIDTEGLLKTYSLDFTGNALSWKLTNTLVTNIKRASKIHGSTIINKFAVVDETGTVLTIWDIMQGVLEYEEQFPIENGAVKDLDWTFISEESTSNAILSIGFSRFVLLYTQLRYDYTNKIPTFATLKKIDISDYTSHEIGDSIWLDGGYLIIGSGNQFFIDDRWVKLGSSTIDSMIRQLMSGYHRNEKSEFTEIYESDEEEGEDETEDEPVEEDSVYDIAHLVRVLNGPLPIYHPQFLVQALFMSQVNSVMKILVKLFQVLRNGDRIAWDLNLDIEQEIYQTQGITVSVKEDQPKQIGVLQRRMSSIFSIDVFTKFNDELADLLTEKLMKISMPLLTRHQQSTLISIIAIVKELNKHLLSLDDNGIRFMIGFKLFQLSTKQHKLSMRDINWALHSDNKELLLNAVEDYYKSRLKWENIKATGLVYWIKTKRFIKLIETAARNEFSETRDPSGRVSLFYLALRKKQILIGLWRTVNHPEQQKMLKFLNNDFTQDRWRSAALKNAFVLLGKHRFMDAAYFFLLGDACDDCCSTIATKLGDIPLAIAIAKVYNGSDSVTNENDNSSLFKVIENYVLPRAVINGDRWTTSWIFWQLGYKELSIQALIKSPITMALDNRDKFVAGRGVQKDEFVVSTKGQSFLRDDPVLILLFNDLRHKKINYLKGSLNITKQEEFQFIIKVCMIYTRMGCDYLALLLLRNWTFNEQELQKTFEWGSPPRTSVLNNKPSQIKMLESEHGSSGGDVPNLLSSFANGDSEAPRKPLVNKSPPPLQAFEEPDMSSFSFGY
ncbi:uncharacterized protein SPAPADRAFT_51318 [Spathaspora passalidarum NRRL Y-27907]|uniref:RAVE complex protein Rav1 C-terminal domain-containing protein n=1 Tax=Spathaspora passalidarum (strain NRRL Y-27907 / 11-Y1) TaxID=619300 RepID=G3ARH2_SPAPN|nr:uncharacterized protein SPAPADRAFT_51318 [Spathaspora passalidarum NRRL Y-27907]EGW31293.1 hypothetical protein SPAPADRAFT_51318 [Spathaspora passalidarum NRRL Y-27907]